MMLSPRTKLDGQEVDLHSYARIFSRLQKKSTINGNLLMVIASMSVMS